MEYPKRHYVLLAYDTKNPGFEDEFKAAIHSLIEKSYGYEYPDSAQFEICSKELNLCMDTSWFDHATECSADAGETAANLMGGYEALLAHAEKGLFNDLRTKSDAEERIGRLAYKYAKKAAQNYSDWQESGGCEEYLSKNIKNSQIAKDLYAAAAMLRRYKDFSFIARKAQRAMEKCDTRLKESVLEALIEEWEALEVSE